MEMITQLHAGVNLPEEKKNLVPIGYKSDRALQSLAIEPRISIPSPVSVWNKLPPLLPTYFNGNIHCISMKRNDTYRPDNRDIAVLEALTRMLNVGIDIGGKADCSHCHILSFLVVPRTLSYLLFSFFLQTFLFIIFSFAKVPV
jgi:hypothetical protein